MYLLAQKAKLAWYKEGDGKSTLFHRAIRARKLQNSVYAIHNTRGEWVEGADAMCNAFLELYKGLLGTALENRVKVKKEIIMMGLRLNNEHTSCLDRLYSTRGSEGGIICYSWGQRP